MRSIHIIDIESQMEFIVAQIVRFLPVAKPGQFQTMLRLAIAHVSQNKGAVGSLELVDYLQPERFLLKCDTLLQIEYVEIVVVKLKFHYFSPHQNKKETPRVSPDTSIFHVRCIKQYTTKCPYYI